MLFHVVKPFLKSDGVIESKLFFFAGRSFPGVVRFALCHF